MSAELIKGAEVAKQIREELQKEIAELKEKHNVVPGLVTVLVGADPASQVYVGAKEKTSKELGIYSERYDLPAETTQQELIELIKKLNDNPKINGILVQLPLPKHLDEEEVLYTIDPKKAAAQWQPGNGVGSNLLRVEVLLRVSHVALNSDHGVHCLRIKGIQHHPRAC